MATVDIGKVLAALPSELAPNKMYVVRVGAGFDLYMTDSTGQIAYKINAVAPTIDFVTASTISRQFQTGDVNKCVPFDASSGVQALIAENVAVPFAIGTPLYVRQVGAGAVSIAPGVNANVTVNGPNGFATNGIGDWRCAVKVGPDEWDVL